MKMNLQNLTQKVPVIIQQRVEERFPAVRESLNCIAALKREASSCVDNCLVPRDDVNEVVGLKVKAVDDVKNEEDPVPTKSTAVDTDPLNGVDVLRDELGVCSETSSGDRIQFLFVNVEDFADTNVEVVPEPTTSPITNTDATDGVDLLTSDLVSCSETCLRSADDEICAIHINVEDIFNEIKVEEDPQPVTFETIKTEPESTLNEELFKCNGRCAVPCNACNKASCNNGNLVTREEVHRGTQLFCCDVCNKTFGQQSDLTRHKQLHTGDWPKQNDFLIRRKHRRTGQWLYSCDLCNKTYVHQNYLFVHKRRHSGEDLLSCDVCNKVFVDQHYLKKHKQIHSGEKPFSCDVCNKAFVFRHCLNSHKLIHGGQRQFYCDVCSKVFVSQGSVKRHMRQHTGERPFSCNVCNKTFTAKHSVKVHMRIHSGERPFSCNVCDMAFVMKRYLVKHMLSHSE